jgi:hypothetical protein
MEHGIRSITSHSTAFLSITFSTVRVLLTVFAAFVLKRHFSCCTSSLLIASSFFWPNNGARCTRMIISFAAIPLGF